MKTKKNELFDIGKADREMKKLDKELMELEKKKQDLNKKEYELSFKLCEEFRITEITDKTLRVRNKVLVNDEIKEIMEKYQIEIDDVALIQERYERFRNLNDRRPLYHSGIDIGRDYLWGGPRDRLKIIFGDYYNGYPYLVGYQFKFPEKPKRDWKATFKKKAA